MKKKIGIYLLTILFFSSFVFFSLSGAKALLTYYSYSKRVSFNATEFLVVEKKRDDYRIKISYNYIYQGINFTGCSLLRKSYPNPWAAKRVLNRYSEEKFTCYVNPKKPELSILNKHFPYRETISWLVLLAVALYFGIMVRLFALTKI